MIASDFELRHAGPRPSMLDIMVLVLLAAASTMSAQVPAEERAALIDLYNSTNGAGWTFAESWNRAEGTECTWNGVTCSSAGSPRRVTNLNLFRRNLVGTLPPSLANLTALQTLDLGANSLTGPVPALTTLASLVALNLSNNQLSGVLPALPASVQDVNLGQNRLTGISSLAGLVSLRSFIAINNQLTGSIPPLSDLRSLQRLWLYNNKLTGSIPPLSALTSLTNLSLFNNQLSGEFPSLAGLSSLEGAAFDVNRLTGGFPSLEGLANLKGISFSANLLTGGVPALAGPASLEYVNASSNQFSGDLPSLSLPSLTYLNLGGCGLTGSLPSLAGLPKLVTLYLGGNRLSGPIPDGLGDATTLEELNLSANALVGRVPASFTRLTKLAAGKTYVGYNGLYSTDDAVINFLTSKEPAWRDTQTAPPRGLAVSGATDTSLTLSWTTIPFTKYSGSYRVLHATSRGGPYTAFGDTADKSTTSMTVPGLAPSTTYYFVVRTISLPNEYNVNNTVVSDISVEIAGTTTGPCPSPGAPDLPTQGVTVTGGQAVLVTWSAALGLDGSARYVVETSHDAFASVAAAFEAGEATSFLVSTNPATSDLTLSVRVRAVQGCGASGPASNVLSVLVRASPSGLVVVQGGPSWSADRGEAPSEADVVVRNGGGTAATLTLTAEGGFFGMTPSTVTVEPGADAAIRLTADAGATTSYGSYHGSLKGRSGAEEVATAVSLTVAPPAPDVTVRATPASVAFSAAPGALAGAVDLVITVDPFREDLYLLLDTSTNAPWLVLPASLPAVPASGLPIRLAVNRPPDTAGAVATQLRIATRGAEAARWAVIDVTYTPELATSSGAGARGRRRPLASAPPGGASFVVPTLVKVRGATGQTFTSDGWLRNLSSRSATAELFFTPDAVDGLSGDGVRRVTLTVPPTRTLRLSDAVRSLFGLESVSGQMELRSEVLGALTLRTVVESILGTDPATRFGTEIPTLAWGAGASGTAELTVTGIDDDDTNRANLILAETTGAGARAEVTVRGSDGAIAGTLALDVPPYGKVQVNRVVSAAAATARSLSGGSLSVKALEGSGKVAALATIIDNRSGSFSVVLGARRRDGPAPRYLVPSVVRTVGQNQTLFRTRLNLSNQTDEPASLRLSFTYVDQDDGAAVKLAERTLVLGPRASLPKAQAEDIVAGFFGIQHRSFGSVLVEGDVERVTAVSAIASQVDPNDPGKGLKVAQVNGIFLDSPDLLSSVSGDRSFTGIEKSFAKRTNLIFVEVDGRACEVLVSLFTDAGTLIASRTFAVNPRQYLQINDVFGDAGVGAGAGPFQNIEVRARVVSGEGRLYGFATVNDNLSRNPEIFPLAPAGAR